MNIMQRYCLKDKEGFSVVHNSAQWRVAVHRYNIAANSISALKEWGRHLDSEEAFILLTGSAVLAIKDAQQVEIENMQPETLYVVAQNQRHALVLSPDSIVFIMENRDMSRFVTEPLDTETIQRMQAALAPQG